MTNHEFIDKVIRLTNGGNLKWRSDGFYYRASTGAHTVKIDHDTKVVTLERGDRLIKIDIWRNRKLYDAIVKKESAYLMSGFSKELA